MQRRVDYTEMKRLRDSGMRNADIAARIGCSEATVFRAPKRFGWDKRGAGPNRPVDAARLFKLWHSEMQQADIAVELGVSISTLYGLKRKYGLPRRPRAAVTPVADPTPEEIAERARQCRERHYADRRGETDENTLQWRRGGVA